MARRKTGLECDEMLKINRNQGSIVLIEKTRYNKSIQSAQGLKLSIGTSCF